MITITRWTVHQCMKITKQLARHQCDTITSRRRLPRPIFEVQAAAGRDLDFTSHLSPDMTSKLPSCGEHHSGSGLVRITGHVWHVAIINSLRLMPGCQADLPSAPIFFWHLRCQTTSRGLPVHPWEAACGLRSCGNARRPHRVMIITPPSYQLLPGRAAALAATVSGRSTGPACGSAPRSVHAHGPPASDVK